MAMGKRVSALPAALALLWAAPAEALEWKQPEPGDQLTTGLIAPAMVPLPDGKTLVIGGLTGQINGATPAFSAVADVYLIDPSAPSPLKMISKVASMSAARHGHATALLPGGRVLVAGGLPDDESTSALASAEIYDPDSNTWATIEVMGAARAFATATALPSGKVLIVGGTDGTTSLDSAESFDPFAKEGAGKWNGLAPMKIGNESLGRHAHSATILQDGRVLVAGGVRGVGATQDALILDLNAPSGQPWSKAASIGQVRAGHTAVRMPSGEVVLLGGCSNPPSFEIATAAADGCVAQTGLRFYSPAKNSWNTLAGATPGDLGGRLFAGLRNGWILAAGGRYKNSAPNVSDGLVEKSVSFFKAPGAAVDDPGTTTAALGPGWSWNEEDSSSELTLKVPIAFAGITVDQKGRVLVVGGLKDKVAQKSIEFLDYLDNGTTCPEAPLNPLDCASGVCSDGVCCDRRCDSVCDACVAARTNLGKDGLCGADTDEEGKTGCKIAGASCSGNSIDGGRCSGGACVDDPQDCGYFKCENSKACPSTCATVNDCRPTISGEPPLVCVASGESSVCSPQLPDGETCAQNVDCKSSACEPAQPALTTLPSPPALCCSKECGADQCDGAEIGAIRNFCNDDPSAPGAFVCQKDYEFCKGYRCKGTGPTTACLVSCNNNDDCAATHFCSGAVCVKKIEDGNGCLNDGQCQSEACAEGVCCDSAACKTDGCRSCLTANTGKPQGQCSPVQSNTDPRDACAQTTGQNPCGQTGVCNESGSCAFVAADTSCQASTCASRVQTDFRCDGLGVCEARSKDCEENLVCDAGGSLCLTSCSSDSDCSGNFACNKGGSVCLKSCESKVDCKAGFNCNTVSKQCVQVATCLEDGRYLDAQGIEQRCRTNHQCDDNTEGGAEACAGPCRSSLDCVSPFVCGASGECRPPPAAAADESDCFCAQAGRPASSSPAALALLALASAALRRRARGGAPSPR